MQSSERDFGRLVALPTAALTDRVQQLTSLDRGHSSRQGSEGRGAPLNFSETLHHRTLGADGPINALPIFSAFVVSWKQHNGWVTVSTPT
jgi:hypothetical protein